MNFRHIKNLVLAILLAAGSAVPLHVHARDAKAAEDLFTQAGKEIKISPEKTAETLAKLEELRPSFTTVQRDRHLLLSASVLGYRGRHKERVELVRANIDQVVDPDYRVRLLYQLSAGYTQLGEYENALVAMNQGILLLPKLTNQIAKMDTLQAAITLHNSLRAYDEAHAYSERLVEIGKEDEHTSVTCVGFADQVEINLLRGERQRARSMLPDAIKICEERGATVIVQILRSLAAIDLIDSGNYLQGKGAGIQLLSEFLEVNKSSDYRTQLEEALARAFLNTGNLEQAERYGLLAYQHAKSGNAVQLMEKTAETMAGIKRAQTQFGAALEYYEAALVLKNRVLDDQLHKNLAFQRVKFDTQDKSNQLNLLEQKNKILAVERELEKKNNQNLLLAIALVAAILVLLTLWLIKTLQQKNQFKEYSQTDGLTQASNRMHFMVSANEAFKMRSGSMSIILFDMDLFKNINDSYGHATGDWVLKSVSETVKTHLRKVDLFGRLGGEEFGICMPESTQASALQLAERCRMAIAMIDTAPSGHVFALSASFGVATVDSNGLTSFESTLEAADRALYSSKAEGRNCVNVFRQVA
ncbi:GGDEF domain-containing protein [Undibacterium sp. TS12]|uniref:tetratricopeptide repeat-containing diguanylate cyclase n=1 Tax=Undibacterium sp. TS12 TaxID=2908202 RepID=UPI001F4CD9D9|nr:GGDEF domain-containing protein [Undibacterium sp. TS12]MCH8622442.1 GGDEF domain-containing protein [Undibacterium sp. TS12]